MKACMYKNIPDASDEPTGMDYPTHHLLQINAIIQQQTTMTANGAQTQ